MDCALKLENISYKYEKDVVLKNINIKIKKKSFFVLLGLNGAGKSTIFSLITRLLSLQEGSLSINGHDIKNYKQALQNVGIVFQESTLDLDLSLRQNLYYYGCMQGLSFKETLASIKQELKIFSLEDKLDTSLRELNQGHRRRVEILRALINEPKILLLDEPTVGLDVKSRFEIISYVRELIKQRDISVLWITHLFDEVMTSDEVTIIKKGEIIENGILHEIISKHNKTSLSEVFEFLTK